MLDKAKQSLSNALMCDNESGADCFFNPLKQQKCNSFERRQKVERIISAIAQIVDGLYSADPNELGFNYFVIL